MNQKKIRRVRKLSLQKLLDDIYKESSNPNNNIYWNYIHEIRKRGRLVEFEKAKELLYSKDALWREIASDILGQLGYRSNSFIEESVKLLLECLKKEKNEDVIRSLIYSLGHRHDSSCVYEVSKYATSKNKDIREAVAFGLCGFKEDKAVNTLILCN